MHAQSRLTLCDRMDYSLPGSSVHGILQARILEGLPFPSPGDLPGPGIGPVSPALTGRFFTAEPPGKPKAILNIFCNSSTFSFYFHFYSSSRICSDISEGRN